MGVNFTCHTSSQEIDYYLLQHSASLKLQTPSYRIFRVLELRWNPEGFRMSLGCFLKSSRVKHIPWEFQRLELMLNHISWAVLDVALAKTNSGDAFKQLSQHVKWCLRLHMDHSWEYKKRCVSWDVHIKVQLFKENAAEEKLNTTLPCQSHRSRDLFKQQDTVKSSVDDGCRFNQGLGGALVWKWISAASIEQVEGRIRKDQLVWFQLLVFELVWYTTSSLPT